MPKRDTSDFKRAQEMTYDRFRSHGAPKEFAQDQAARARDRLEKRHDDGTNKRKDK
jgi:hypothetical protein